MKDCYRSASIRESAAKARQAATSRTRRRSNVGTVADSRNELLVERDQLDAQPAVASVALQRQRIESVVDDWFVMTDDEKKLVVQMIFAEIRADHAPDGLKVEFRSRAAWEPYVEAVLVTQKQQEKGSAPVTTSVARRGFEPLTSSLKVMRSREAA